MVRPYNQLVRQYNYRGGGRACHDTMTIVRSVAPFLVDAVDTVTAIAAFVT
ncbi:hypothetical protein Daura_20300 [Dactylosporangium aurantiacum]|uniref:Uncharacterized protein n=1 Tax=Dactylosporangium aurantiacum TaxID=35754 RepID=A0A9Q9ILE5_9ACTN|nr:hypothetical protein [Dactylosporangium aurantiacum]MDG6106191.1 hypothetical protein [Dactylosporangium aurantiacum]UWZ58307.1 hypothetical protein Daura_20300 [Dactylosporangium aurantiacum]